MGGISRRAVLGGVGGTAALAVVSGTVAAGGDEALAGGSDGPIRPVRLTVEHLTDPLGIDAPAPRLGWRLEASGTGRVQTAYQILVARGIDQVRQGRPDVWDSGKVASEEQTARSYAGPPLASRTRYYWAVRAWDEQGRPGPLSDVAWFETALLAEDDWAAEWIGSGIELPYGVRTLGPTRLAAEPLRPGQTLGQTFVSEPPLTGVSVLLSVGSGGGSGGGGDSGGDSAGGLTAGGDVGCAVTLRREGPDGPVLGQAAYTGLVGDEYDLTSLRLDLSEPAEPGRFYLELSESQGEVGWMGVTYADPEQEDVYPDGAAYADGVERPDADRWLYGFAPPPPASPLLRREFHLDGPVVSARLYICGLGHAVAWVNGRRAGDAVLAPLCTDYDVRAFYSTYDVTSVLRSGRNAIGVALGRGFFSTRSPHEDGSHLAPWLAEPQLKAQLEVVLAGGRRVTIGTGPDWALIEGPTTYEGLFAGESYDAGRAAELAGWTSPGYPARDWRAPVVMAGPRGRLEAYAGVPIRAREPVAPVSVTRPAEGVLLYDFGVVLSGWVRLSGRVPEGVTVRMLYAEKLGADGRIDPGPPGSYDNPAIDGRHQIDEYTGTGAERETWEATFTYKAFQYVEVTWSGGAGGTAGSASGGGAGGTAGGGAADGAGVPELELLAVPVHSDVDSTLDLELGDPTLQWIADAIRQTNLNGLHGHPDISPYGKLGWLSATERASRPLLAMFDMTSPFGKWLEDIRLSQAESGEIPMVAPVGGTLAGLLLSPTTTALYPALVRRYWLAYGDQTVPARHFGAVRRYIEWVLSQIREELPDDIFGDWYPPLYDKGRPPNPPEGGRLVGTAYVIANLRDAIALADLLGHADLAATWRSETADLVRRFNDAFLDTAAGVYRTGVGEAGYRQASNAIPLVSGLVPDAYVDAVAANLAADVEARNRHLDTGALGTGALPFALTDHGRPDLAHAVLTRTDYPSYGYLRTLGATTLWESWEAESRAHNDTTLSEPFRWFVERVLGVEALRPGWARFRVAPKAFNSLPGARMGLDTVRGRIVVAWRRREDGRSAEFSLRVPVNAVAELTLPDGTTHELGSGAYGFASTLPETPA